MQVQGARPKPKARGKGKGQECINPHPPRGKRGASPWQAPPRFWQASVFIRKNFQKTSGKRPGAWQAPTAHSPFIKLKGRKLLRAGPRRAGSKILPALAVLAASTVRATGRRHAPETPLGSPHALWHLHAQVPAHLPGRPLAVGQRQPACALAYAPLAPISGVCASATSLKVLESDIANLKRKLPPV